MTSGIDVNLYGDGKENFYNRRSAMTNHFKTDGTIQTSVTKKAPTAQIKRLAEAILLQSLEDLWIDEEKSNSIVFFGGEGFRICSEIAGMSSDEKVKMLNIIQDIVHHNSGKDDGVRGIRAEQSAVYELVL